MRKMTKITLCERYFAKEGGVVLFQGNKHDEDSHDVVLYEHFMPFTTPELLAEIRRIGFFAFAYCEMQRKTNQRVYTLVISQTPNLDIFLERKGENRVQIPTLRHETPLPHNNERVARVCFWNDHYIAFDVNEKIIRSGAETEFMCSFRPPGREGVEIIDPRGVSELVHSLNRFSTVSR